MVASVTYATRASEHRTPARRYAGPSARCAPVTDRHGARPRRRPAGLWIGLCLGAAGALGAACAKEAPVYSGTVCFEVYHHSQPFNGATLYLAAGAERLPGFRQNELAAYDESRETGLSNRACFEQLGLGPHAFAAQGYDELLRDTVRGEFYLSLDVRERRVDTVMQVSERH